MHHLQSAIRRQACVHPNLTRTVVVLSQMQPNHRRLDHGSKSRLIFDRAIVHDFVLDQKIYRARKKDRAMNESRKIVLD